METLVDYMEISRTQSRCQIQNSPQGCYRSIKSSKLNTASGFRIFLQAVCGSSNIVTDVYLNPKKQFWSNFDKISDYPVSTHYSKSQIFIHKFNFDRTPTFSRIFHPKFFWQFFSWNQSCQQLKSPRPQHFHEFFTPKKIRQFSREIKVEFLEKKMKISNRVIM